MHITIKSVKRPAQPSWLSSRFQDGEFPLETFSTCGRIEELAAAAEAAGRMPLWSGYRSAYAGSKRSINEESRTSNQVRTRQSSGLFYYRLVRDLLPTTIVEIGTAFGVSGMYWLAALEDNDKGRLLTFDPNDTWRAIAISNLAAIGTRFTSFLGTFEEHFHEALTPNTTVDLAFVDGIHTSAFVLPQVRMLREKMGAGAILILDDIRFSKDMYRCWSDLATAESARASIEVGGRVGIIECAH